MKEFKGTQGPWFKEDDSWSDGEHSVISCESREGMVPVAMINGGGSESGYEERFVTEQRANANLIAAAPELLEVLQFINDSINHGTQMDIVKGQEMAELAIKKALGE